MSNDVLYISENSSRDLTAFTGRHVGEAVDISIGEGLMGTPMIHSPIYGPQIPIPRPVTDTKQRLSLIFTQANGRLPTHMLTSKAACSTSGYALK